MRLTQRSSPNPTTPPLDLLRERATRSQQPVREDRRPTTASEPLEAAQPHAPIDWDHYAESRMHDFQGR